MISYYKPMEDNDIPREWPIYTPGVWLAGFTTGITKHCYTQNIKSYVFPSVSLWELMTHGRSQFGSQGHDWQDLCRVPLSIATY